MNLRIKCILCLCIICIIIFCGTQYSMAMTFYQTVPTPTGFITANALNVRSGPGTRYNVIDVVYKNEYVRLFAKINDWYVIQTDEDFVGCVSGKYIKLIYPETVTSDINTDEQENTSSVLTQDEIEVFNLINKERTSKGLKELKIEDDLQNVARIKVQDLVDNNYFDHKSPTYGSPFEMMKNFGITYTYAGENIAGNSNNLSAVTEWMNSEGHRKNILNENFEYTGIGVVSSQTYGKIYVQMFIKK